MVRNSVIRGSLAVLLVLGLSSCALFEEGSNPTYDRSIPNTHEHPATEEVKAVTTTTTTVNAGTSSKEPIQKSTPGPKRAAAPQLPVIQ